MTDYGNFGTSPYKRVVLDNTNITGADTPYPLSFTGDPQTGIYRKAAGVVGIGSAGVETVSFTAYGFTENTAIGLTATGLTIAGALQLTNAINFVESGVTAAGVILPSAASVGIGGCVTIFNTATVNPIQVYGSGSDTIDGAAATTGVALSASKRAAFYVKKAATWVSAQLGAVSS